MSAFDLGRGVDPVPAAWRRAEPGRNRLARELEPQVALEVRSKHDEPLDLENREREQRVHYVLYPRGYEPPMRPNHDYIDRLAAGFIYWLAGAWFWRPSYSIEGSPDLAELGMDQEPSEELDVETEHEAKLHARRRVAWELAE